MCFHILTRWDGKIVLHGQQRSKYFCRYPKDELLRGSSRALFNKYNL